MTTPVTTKPLTGDKLTIHNLQEKISQQAEDVRVGKIVRAMVSGQTEVTPMGGREVEIKIRDWTAADRLKHG